MPYQNLIFRGTNLLKWGVGKGVNLIAEEIDENFWQVIQRILSLENNPPVPVSIDFITVVGTSMTVTLTDATVLGPFTLPTNAFTWRDEWQPGTEYNQLDIFFVPEDGVYMVLHAHESASEFSEEEASTEGPLYHLMFGVPKVYDFGSFVGGPVGASENPGESMWEFVCVRPFYLPVDAVGSVFKLRVPALDDMTVPVHRNGVEVGQVFFEGAPEPHTDFPTEVTEPHTEPPTESPTEFEGRRSGVATVPALTQFVFGDVIQMIRPSQLDANAAHLTFTFAAVRGTA